MSTIPRQHPKNTVMSSGVPFQSQDQFHLLRDITDAKHLTLGEGEGYEFALNPDSPTQYFRGEYKGVPVYFSMEREGFYDVWLVSERYPQIISELRTAAGFKTPRFQRRSRTTGGLSPKEISELSPEEWEEHRQRKGE